MKIIISILFITGVILFLIEFVSIKFFNIGFVHLSELRNYLILISTFLAMTTGILKDKNIKMDILNKYTNNTIFFILKNIISVIISTVITYLFIKYMLFEKENNTKTFFNINKYYLLIPYILVFTTSITMYLVNIKNRLIKKTRKK